MVGQLRHLSYVLDRVKRTRPEAFAQPMTFAELEEIILEAIENGRAKSVEHMPTH